LKEYGWNHSDVHYNSKENSIKKLTGTNEDWEIIFAETGEDTNTGARIKKIEKYIDDDNFFLTYGDGVSDVDLKELLEFHLNKGKITTVTAVRPKSRFGSLEIDGHEINEFVKKALTSQGWIDGGFFVMNKKIFNYLNEDDSCMLEREPLQKLAKDGQFAAYKHERFWQCMDTQKEVELLADFVKTKQAPWMIWSK